MRAMKRHSQDIEESREKTNDCSWAEYRQEKRMKGRDDQGRQQYSGNILRHFEGGERRE